MIEIKLENWDWMPLVFGTIRTSVQHQYTGVGCVLLESPFDSALALASVCFVVAASYSNLDTEQLADEASLIKNLTINWLFAN